jgi:hypothetical protein
VRRRVTDVGRESDLHHHVRLWSRCEPCAGARHRWPFVAEVRSDGVGYELAARFGHGYVETTPALAPLLVEGDRHASLSGVSLPVRLTVRVEGRRETRLEGALLWTHFGASGPVVLNASRHWHRARLEGRRVECCSICVGRHVRVTRAWVRRRRSSVARWSQRCWLLDFRRRRDLGAAGIEA